MTGLHLVIFTAAARKDVSDIYSWIDARSNGGAIRWLKGMEEAQQQVAMNPLAFGLARESRRLNSEVREKLFSTPQGRSYRLLYSVHKKNVHILRVRGARQRPIGKSDLNLDPLDG